MTPRLLASFRPFSTSILACLGLFVLGGCASSNALRRALDEREMELSAEKEEHADTYQRLQEALANQRELEARLRDASARPAAQDSAPAFPELDELGVSTGLRNGQVVITLPSAITFPSGKADLSESGQRALRAVAKRLSSEFGGATFYVEGHTDSDPISKSAYPSNRELSLARALAVHAFLVDQCDVPDSRFVVAGYGEYRPQAPNTSAANKARNRRVEIVVHAARP